MAGAATGGSTVLAKQAVGVYDSPLAITVLGMLAAVFIVVPCGHGHRLAEIPPSGRSTGDPWVRCHFGCEHHGASIIAQLFAVQRADVVIVAPILATFPLWTLLLSHIFIARLEQITLRLTLGTLVTVAGVVAVILGGQL